MTEEYVRKTIKIDKELWIQFQKKIEENYGTTYKHTSEEIEKALDNYTSKDVENLEKTKKEIKKLRQENKDLKGENTEILKKYNESQDKLLNLTGIYKKDTADNQKQKESIGNLKNEIYNLKDEIKNLNSKIENLNDEITQAQKLNKVQEAEIKKLQENNRNLEKKYIEQVEETNKQVKENTKIKNKREHAQERLNKTQDELNNSLKRLEKYSYAIGQIQNMSLIDRLFNRLPQQIKELQAGEEAINNEDEESEKTD